MLLNFKTSQNKINNMKKHLAARTKIPAFLSAFVFATLVISAPHMVEASSTSEKIRLMADTLRARDSGNLDLAKSSAEELIKIAPKDKNVQRLLAAINREISRRAPITSAPETSSLVYGQAADISVEAAMTIPPSAAPSVVSSETDLAESIVTAAAADQDAKIAAADSAINDALELAEIGAYTDASNLLNTASSSLILNTATAGYTGRNQKCKGRYRPY